MGWVQPVAGGFVERFLFVQRPVCGACYRRVNWLHYLRFIAMFVALAGMGAALIGGGFAMISAESRFGKGSWQHSLAIAGFAISGVAPIPLAVWYVKCVVPRRTAKLLSPSASQTLLSMGVAPEWALRSRLSVYRRLPWGAKAVE